MSSPPSARVLSLLFLLLLLPAASSATGPTAVPHPFSKIYAFGDSLTDTGNSDVCDIPPYGTTFFHSPMHRCSDGRLVIDFVAQSLGLPFLPPYRNSHGSTNGVNFAVAGATAIDHEFFVRNNLSLDTTPESIQTQLLWFERYLHSEGHCRTAADGSNTRGCGFEDALFWVGEIGGNDYLYTLGSSVSSYLVRELVVSTVASFLERLLEKGAKYVVVQGQEAGGCDTIPQILYPEAERDEMGCVKSENDLTYVHNLLLLSKLQHLRARFPEAVIVYADFWSAFRAVAGDPTKYGFAEMFEPCCWAGVVPYQSGTSRRCGTPWAAVCESPSEHVSWDGIHYTEAMNRIMADMFLRRGFTHPPFDHLLSKNEDAKSRAM